MLALASTLLAATTLLAAPSPSPTEPCVGRRSEDREHPDLGVVRWRDPACARGIHLGLDFGGVVVPRGLGGLDRAVWTLRGGPAWAIRLAKVVSLGGRHGITFYDARDVRLRVHDHQLEAALHPMVQAGLPRVHDRLVLGVETHALLETRVDGKPFKLGGVRDTIAYVGYGVEHRVAKRWSFGGQAHYRHAWVFRDTQRQVRAALRVTLLPTPAHRLALETTGLFVDRDPNQAGVSLPRRGVYGQIAAEYGWMASVGVGPFVRARVASGLMGGEVPIFEIRREVLRTAWGDVTVGVRGSF